MKKSELAQEAYEFLAELKREVLHQILYLNQISEGALQDGFNPLFLDDGWVTLKGFSWGFVMHYDDPVRLDMTFGPDQPFVGHRITLLAQPIGELLGWVNQQNDNEVYFNAEQLAHQGLVRLAQKSGDTWLFQEPAMLRPGASPAIFADYMNEAL